MPVGDALDGVASEWPATVHSPAPFMSWGKCPKGLEHILPDPRYPPLKGASPPPREMQHWASREADELGELEAEAMLSYDRAGTSL